jgi:hypothetical protein
MSRKTGALRMRARAIVNRTSESGKGNVQGERERNVFKLEEELP